MSMQVSKVWWDGEKLMAEPINAADVYKPEPVTEWLTCPKCKHKSPYSPIKAKTLAEDAERITRQARQALAEQAAQQELVRDFWYPGLSPQELRDTSQQQESLAWSDEQLQMLNFLYGAGEFDGVWFDQKHPTEKGAFWWRKHLRRLFDAPPQAREPVGRTDQEIVDETEALAKWLMAWSFNHHPKTNAPIRQSEHPFAKSCWAAACHIQEMLTATDPENAVAELDGEAQCKHCHGIGYDASGYACSCTQEAA